MSQKIIRLQAENVKRLRAVEIEPGGSVVLIRGENGQGKSSVLDSIEYLLGGKETHPPRVIRDGEEEATIIGELTDLVVERRFTATGTQVEVRAKDGAKLRSPQAILDKLYSSFTFDPLAFLRLLPPQQAEVLRKLVGLDFSLIDEERQRIYDHRTMVNREVTQAEAQLAGKLQPEGPDEPEDIAELAAELRRRGEEKSRQDRLRTDLTRAAHVYQLHRQNHDNLRARIVDLEKQLESAKEELLTASGLIKEATDEGTRARAAIANLVEPDLNEVAERITAAENRNAVVRARRVWAEQHARLEERRRESELSTQAIAHIDATKAAAIAAAKFPVPGLSFADRAVSFKGLPLEQASSAEQLRVSLAMAIAMNPELKVVLIREGSLLDARSMAMVAEMAEQADAQVWIEVVGEEGVGVIIEDGRVKA